jgi:hypothetical protein
VLKAYTPQQLKPWMCNSCGPQRGVLRLIVESPEESLAALLSDLRPEVVRARPIPSSGSTFADSRQLVEYNVSSNRQKRNFR